ncbi:hypothetical protein GN956_G22132 [Arapaima gigas]
MGVLRTRAAPSVQQQTGTERDTNWRNCAVGLRAPLAAANIRQYCSGLTLDSGQRARRLNRSAAEDSTKWTS